MFDFDELPAEFELPSDNVLIANGEEGERDVDWEEPSFTVDGSGGYNSRSGTARLATQMANGFTLKLGAHQEHSITGLFKSAIDVATDDGRCLFLDAVRASLGDAVYAHQVNL